MKNLIAFLAFLSSPLAWAQVTIPYTFSPGQTISSSYVNADFSAVANEINTHENATNPHQTTLAQVLALGNSTGAYSLNLNLNQLLNAEVENLSADPSPGSAGRVFINTTTHLLKFDDGTNIQTVGGSGSNNLSSVLNSGNSAGSYNLDMNANQILNLRVENRTSDPSATAGRIYYRTDTTSLKVCSGASCTSVGGSQGLSSVLGVSNSAGSTNLDFNSNQAKNMVLDSLSSDPGSPTAGQVWYNTTSHIPKFYNGTSSLAVGNTNTLAQTVALGNTTGGDVDFGGNKALNLVVFNNNGSPGTGTGGFIWYDTGTSSLNFETSGSNRRVATLDGTETLTGKSISGGSNTLTSIPDGALSGNVELLTGVQTVSGKKTYSSAPVISKIKTLTGTTLGHTIPDGLADDTFVLASATQSLSGKTFAGLTMSGNADFAEFQATHFRVENLSSVPGSAANSGRVIYSSGDGLLHYDDGSTWRTLGINTSNLTSALAAGNSAGPYNIDFNLNQALNLVMEKKSSNPTPSTAGRLYYNTTTPIPMYDTGAAVIALADVSSAQSFSNKTLVAPTISGTVNLSGLTASQAVFTDSSKNLVSNAISGTGSVAMTASPAFTGAPSVGTTTAINPISSTPNLRLYGISPLALYPTATNTAFAMYNTDFDPTNAGSALAMGFSANTGAAAVNINSYGAGVSGGGSIKFQTTGGAATFGGTVGITGIATFTVAPVLSSTTASQALFTDASKNVVSNAITGSGNVVMSTSPTVTGMTANGVTAMTSATHTGTSTASAFVTNSANPPSLGILRMASGDSYAWRNNANSADLLFGKNTSDQLTWSGTAFLSASGVLLAAGFPALTGDITTSAGALATTLASSISGAKTFSTSLQSPAFITNTANPAAAGVLRLANTEAINWRNNANGADVSLAKNTSDQLSYGGTAFLSSAGVLLAAGEPAHTGDVTNSAGSLALSIAATTNATLTTISTLVSLGTITTGVWNAGAVTSSGTIKTSGTTDSTSPTTGSLQSAGGLGVAKSIFVGNSSNRGQITIQGTSGSDPLFYLDDTNATGGKKWLITNGNANAGWLTFRQDTDAHNYMSVDGTGTLYLPGLASSSSTTTGTLCWTTSTGLVNVDTTTTCLLSGRQYKEQIQPLVETDGLTAVMKMNPVSYQLKAQYNPAHLGRQVGFIADEMAAIDNRLVSYDESGVAHAVRYQQMAALLVKAIQQQQGQITALQTALADLRGRVK